MAKCVFTGKQVRSANNVSHANNRTKRQQLPNVHTKRVFVPELGRTVRISLSARALRTVTKLGLVAYARKIGLDLKSLVS